MSPRTGGNDEMSGTLPQTHLVEEHEMKVEALTVFYGIVMGIQSNDY